MIAFSVTYDIYTQESIEAGETADDGFICQNVSLRDAIAAVCETDNNTCERTNIESSDSRISHARWFTVYNSMDWISGDTEHRSLHIPESVTASSRKRIARLLGIVCR
jgi:hypothetical protein